MEMARVKIRKRFWLLKFTNVLRKGNIGECHSHAKRELRIRKDLDEQLALDCLLHESLHAAFPDLKEDAVNEASTDITKIMWDLGYRRCQS
jgi:hypothetical protein